MKSSYKGRGVHKRKKKRYRTIYSLMSELLKLMRFALPKTGFCQQQSQEMLNSKVLSSNLASLLAGPHR